MKKVYTADNLPMAGYVKSLLDSNKHECIIKNQNLTGAIGELPPIECWPEVWIINDEDYAGAIKLVNSFLDESNDDKNWTCQCGEMIEGQFRTCWSCGFEMAD